MHNPYENTKLRSILDFLVLPVYAFEVIVTSWVVLNCICECL